MGEYHIDWHMAQPNILFIILDACRYDFAVEHASFLNELGASNIWFEKAVAPSPWSLPSHASLFTGQLPHEHGMNQLQDSIDTPLVRNLKDKGYTTYGVSANGFASQRTGFHEDFDWFRYTGGRDIYLDGMDVSGTAQEILQNQEGTLSEALTSVLKTIPGHGNIGKSFTNLMAVTIGELATKFAFLQTIPHPTFAPTSDYSYNPEKNTHAIQDLLREVNNDDPFFVFTNYMDTHRCYKPPNNIQKNHLGQRLDYRELVRLNEEIASPWKFEGNKANEDIKKSDIENIRGLYAGEVENVDSHLEIIHQTLEEEGLLEDTLVIITADHGENLGETDEIGRQRMGHEASVSENVLHVPLAISHPKISSRIVTEAVSLTDLFDLIINPEPLIESDSDEIPYFSTEGPVASQYPRKGGEHETQEKNPAVPKETIKLATSEDSAVAYKNGWKLISESTGEKWALKNGKHWNSNDAPNELRDLANTHLEKLREANDYGALSEREVEQLESLGYI